MKALVWFVLAAIIGAIVYFILRLRRQWAEREEASAARMASLIAQAKPAAPPLNVASAPVQAVAPQERLLLEAASKAGETRPLTQGVVATQAQIVEALKRHGITPIEALGQPFDPMKHQAIQTQPATKGQAPNTVAQVAQKGFMIHDRVLRPAAVIVAQ